MKWNVWWYQCVWFSTWSSHTLLIGCEHQTARLGTPYCRVCSNDHIQMEMLIAYSKTLFSFYDMTIGLLLRLVERWFLHDSFDPSLGSWGFDVWGLHAPPKCMSIWGRLKRCPWTEHLDRSKSLASTCRCKPIRTSYAGFCIPPRVGWVGPIWPSA